MRDLSKTHANFAHDSAADLSSLFDQGQDGLFATMSTGADGFAETGFAEILKDLF